MADAPQSDIAGLVRDHHTSLYRYAFRLTGSTADAEDLTQQTFLQAQEKFEQLRQADRAGAWLRTILRNCYLKTVGRKAPQTAGDLALDVDQLPEANPQEPPIDQAELQAAIDQLPEPFKVVLLMFYFEECSYKEIARQLDLPAGTVMSRLSRAKAHLRSKLIGDRQSALER